jgi:L-amino acid N-acyltransferase YncA
MTGVFTFEPMAASHSGAVMEIFNGYIAKSFAAYPDRELPEGFFARFMEMTKGYPAYVMTFGGTVAGFCFLHPYNPLPTFRGCAEVTYFIRQEYTGQGLGKAALQKLEEEAARMNIHTLLASISSENEQSLSFHRKYGFTECGRLPGVGKKLGKAFDVVWMVKRIA